MDERLQSLLGKMVSVYHARGWVEGTLAYVRLTGCYSVVHPSLVAKFDFSATEVSEIKNSCHGPAIYVREVVP